MLHKRQRNKLIDHLLVSQGAVIDHSSVDEGMEVFDAPQDCLKEVEIAALLAKSGPEDFKECTYMGCFKVQNDSEDIDRPIWIICGLGVAGAAVNRRGNRGIGGWNGIHAVTQHA